jgi:hypothetical protein
MRQASSTYVIRGTLQVLLVALFVATLVSTILPHPFNPIVPLSAAALFFAVFMALAWLRCPGCDKAIWSLDQRGASKTLLSSVTNCPHCGLGLAGGHDQRDR